MTLQRHMEPEMNSRTPANLVERLKAFILTNPTDAHKVMHQFVALGRPLLLRSELIVRTRRGRMATDKAYRHFKQTPPEASA